MKLVSISLLALSSSVQAFKDTSPFFTFSSSTNALPKSTVSQLQQPLLSISRLHDALADLSKSCSSQAYVFVHQPGASTSDFRKHNSVPHLRQRLSNGDALQTEIAGYMGMDKVKDVLANSCKARQTSYSLGDSLTKDDLTKEGKLVISIDLPRLSHDGKERSNELYAHDSFVNAFLENALKSVDYTIIYTTTPPKARALESEGTNAGWHDADVPHGVVEWDEIPFHESLHTDLKRDVSSHDRLQQRASSNSSSSSAGLFERYKYVNAAVFQGGIAAFILISIMYVAISAVAGVEVSYMAFSKEMGPAAQKKQQQSGGNQ